MLVFAGRGGGRCWLHARPGLVTQGTPGGGVLADAERLREGYRFPLRAAWASTVWSRFEKLKRGLIDTEGGEGGQMGGFPFFLSGEP